MTVFLGDSPELADTNDELLLDDMFHRLERVAPEGFKVDVVGGTVFMSPQRDTHWQITIGIAEQLRTRYPLRRIKSDVRIDYPGHLNAFCSDVVLVADKAKKNAKGQWHHRDVEFVAEVVSEGTAHNDYGPKRTAYATAEVPVYLIADPYERKCHLYTTPKEDQYQAEVTVTFGTDLDLTDTPAQLILKTDEFPSD